MTRPSPALQRVRRSRLTEPHAGFSVFLRRACCVHPPEYELCVGVASLDLDRLVEPGDGFGGIRRHTVPLCIHDPEPVLCVGVPLLRGLTEPSDGGNVIPLYAEPFCVPHPDGVLRRSVTLLDRLSVQLAIQGPFAEPGASGDSEDQKAAGREQGHLDNVRSKWPGGGASGE